MTMFLFKFQNEAECKTFVVKMSFMCMKIKNHFQTNGLALSLALKQRLEATRKWTVEVVNETVTCSENIEKKFRAI